MITILGTGLLGTGFATALLNKGENVHVWNRTVEQKNGERFKTLGKNVGVI